MKTVSNMAKHMRRRLKQFFNSSMESTIIDSMFPMRPTTATGNCKQKISVGTRIMVLTSRTPSSRKEQDDADSSAEGIVEKGAQTELMK
jgi:hypothetical protein